MYKQLIETEITDVANLMAHINIELGVNKIDYKKATHLKALRKYKSYQTCYVSCSDGIHQFDVNPLEECNKIEQRNKKYVTTLNINGVDYLASTTSNRIELKNVNNDEQCTVKVPSKFLQSRQFGDRKGIIESVQTLKRKGQTYIVGTHGNLGAFKANIENLIHQTNYHILKKDIIHHAKSSLIRAIVRGPSLLVSDGNVLHTYYPEGEPIHSFPSQIKITALQLDEMSNLYMGTSSGGIYCNSDKIFQTSSRNEIKKIQVINDNIAYLEISDLYLNGKCTERNVHDFALSRDNIYFTRGNNLVKKIINNTRSVDNDSIELTGKPYALHIFGGH
tara:strand:- start:29908 stop:30909 length:1002 start_codon:yes stop_codon:yes gene_type:complete